MGAVGLGPWEPLSIDEVVALLGEASFRWWIAGGHALEAHVGRSWRSHDDTDVGIVRHDAGELTDVLAGWDVHVAAAGVLTPWDGGPLDASRSQNNLWCRRSPAHPWCLDVLLGDGDDESWIYRRDPTIRRPWAEAVLRDRSGTPYLAPELQLLFKSKSLRPKDDVDAHAVVPLLGPERRTRLASYLAPTHPWQLTIAEARARLAATRLLGKVDEVAPLAPGRSSQAWMVSHGGGRHAVRMPIRESGRVVSFRSEALIGALLADAGHPVSEWRTVTADDIECSIGPLLDGEPVEEGSPWTPAFAAGLADLLADLHRLPATGFGPLDDDAARLSGRSASVTAGIVDRWSRAAVWPFDDTPLATHPLSRLAPDLAELAAAMEQRIRDAAGEPYGVVHSDLHRQHLLHADGDLAGVLDFGDAFVGSTAWDFALLHWYHGAANTRLVADRYGEGHDLFDRGRTLAVAVGSYKLAKSPNDADADAGPVARLAALLR